MRALSVFGICFGLSLLCGAVETAVTKKLAQTLDDELWKVVADGARWNPNTFSLPALAPANTEVLLRRVYVDALGRLPTAEEVRVYFEERDRDALDHLIDRLLDSPEWSERHFRRLASWLRVVDEVQGASQQRYVDWLKAEARANRPMDQLVKHLLTAEGTLESDPATGYLLRDHGWMTHTAAETAFAFLGADLGCAACHDHPYADWTQLSYYQLAACFAGMKITPASAKHEPELWPAMAKESLAAREQIHAQGLRIVNAAEGLLRVPANYHYRNANPGDPVHAKVLPFFTERESPPAKRVSEANADEARQAFADWLVTHPMFAAKLGQFMAEELLWSGPEERRISEEPSDAVMHDGPSHTASMTNVLSNKACYSREGEVNSPAQLAETDRVTLQLAVVVRELKFDLREVQRVLMHTPSYRRESYSPELGQPLTPLAPVLRRLPAETVWDFLEACADGMDVPSAALPQRLPADHPLRLLGRGARLWTADDQTHVSYALVRWMLNGDLPQRAAEGLAKKVKNIDDLYLTVLARYPNPRERQEGNKATLTDAAAALLCSGEFLFLR